MPTDLQLLWRAWKALLPDDIQIVAGPLMTTAPPLTFKECNSAGAVAPQRMSELMTGRYYAKQALSLLGFDDVELPINEDRSPAWPSGTTGSITHIRRAETEGYCAVAVGRSDQFRAIGIDVEYGVALPREIWATFLTPRELNQVLALDRIDQPANALIRWCVKECAIKAFWTGLDPLTIDAEKTDGPWRVAVCRKNLFEPAAETFFYVQSAQVGDYFMAATVVMQA